MRKDEMSPMQHKIPSDEEQEENARPEAGTAEKKRRRGQWAFVRWKREDQLKAFFGWLPQELHDAPGINWTELAPEIMGYLVKTVGRSPDAAVMAVAAASMHGAIDKISQYTLIKNLGTLLKSLRATTSVQCLVDLQQEQVWFDWAALQEKKVVERHTLAAYASIAAGHF